MTAGVRRQHRPLARAFGPDSRAGTSGGSYVSGRASKQKVLSEDGLRLGDVQARVRDYRVQRAQGGIGVSPQWLK